MHHLPFRRSRLLVDRPLQWSLCAHALGIGVFAIAAVMLGLFLPPLWQLVRGADDDPERASAATVMLYMHEQFWLLAAGSLAVVAVWALRLSHRIAGPMVRFKRNLRLLAEGRLPPPLRTRRRDYLKEEVECLNAAVQGVRERVEALQAAQVALRRALRDVEASREPAVQAAFAAVRVAQLEAERWLQTFRETGELDVVHPRGSAAVMALADQGPRQD